MFCDAPKLRIVTIGNESIGVGLPYHQLEKLTLWGYSHDSASVAFLNKCTNLTFCSIHANQDLLARWTKPKRGLCMFVNLPKLVKLEIISWDSGQWLLGYFSAPALESITISLKGPIEIEAFLAFLTRSNVALKRLSIIDYIAQEEEALLKMFDVLPYLTHLELDELRHDKPGLHDTLWLPSCTFFDYLGTPNMTLGAIGLPLSQLISFEYRGRFHNSENDGADVDTLEKMLLARPNTISLPALRDSKCSVCRLYTRRNQLQSWSNHPS